MRSDENDMNLPAEQAGAGTGVDRYVSADAFMENLSRQVTLTPRSVAHLRQHGVTEQSWQKLLFYFYTDTMEKAVALAWVLRQKGYAVAHGPDPRKRSSFRISGWTTPLLMTEPIVAEWAKEMIQLGFEHDCQFDTWGTLPPQT